MPGLSERTDPRNHDARGAEPGAPWTVGGLRNLTGQLSTADRARIVQQALVLLEGVYVHLPFKRAMHAIDPVQRLKLLAVRLDRLSDARFHAEMIGIFASLRDLHTQYLLPQPYSSLVAYLPFLPEEFFEEGRRGYVVSKLVPGFEHPTFKPGVLVTYWNGVPFERAVDLNAERQGGSNEAARHAHGLELMCFRPMGFTAPPDEDWVVVGYNDGVEDRELRLEWQIVDPTAPPQGVAAHDPSASGVENLAIDVRTELLRRAKKLVFAPAAMRAEVDMARIAPLAAAPPPKVPEGQSVMPDVFEFREASGPGGPFGYIRIRTFNVSDADAFVAEFVRMAGLLPEGGLVIDVRGNPGGLATAGEQLLQVLTPRPIDPERLQFINTSLTHRLAAATDSLVPWRDSIAQAVETGAVYSLGFPLQPVEDYNRVGQQYWGPIVLITDALCYSTTDIFAAGFQDHEIGPVVGTSSNTGAGGANLWTYELLSARMPGPDSPFQPLPAGTSFHVAIRRMTRVGPRSGVPVEDLGVQPDERYNMTLRDVLYGNEDLIAFAGHVLARLRVHRLSAVVEEGAGGAANVRLDTRNLSRLDVLFDGRPALTLDVTDGPSELAVTVPQGARLLEVVGYDGDRLAARRRLPVNAVGRSTACLLDRRLLERLLTLVVAQSRPASPQPQPPSDVVP